MSFHRNLSPAESKSSSHEGLSDTARNALAGIAAQQNPADLLIPNETYVTRDRIIIPGYIWLNSRLDGNPYSAPEIFYSHINYEAIIEPVIGSILSEPSSADMIPLDIDSLDLYINRDIDSSSSFEYGGQE